MLESRELLSAGGPSAEAQYMLTMLNQARTNPPAAAERATSNLDANVQATLQYYNVDLNAVKNTIANSAPRPPLAWNDTLAMTATGQSQDQANTGTQSHYGANGSTLDQRLDGAGYTNRASSGENAYAYSTSVDEAMEAFLIDWGVSSNGHRNDIVQPNASPDQYYREVGIGIVDSNRPNFGPEVITQDFGRRAGSKAELLGVAYNDPNHQHVYALGSGVGNVEIDAVNVDTGATASTLTWDNGGGYQMPLDPGTWRITAKDGGQVVRVDQISVSDQNIELDYDLSDPWQNPAPVAPQAQMASPPQAPTAAGSTVTNGVLPSKPTANAGSTSWFSKWTSWSARTAF
jgi:uncharacterized protein YkwD